MIDKLILIGGVFQIRKRRWIPRFIYAICLNDITEITPENITVHRVATTTVK